MTDSVSGLSRDTLISLNFKPVQFKCLSLRFLINGPNDVKLDVHVRKISHEVYSSGRWQHTRNKWRRGYVKVMDDVDFSVDITATITPRLAQRHVVTL